MSIKTTIFYSLPEDTGTDTIELYESASKASGYTVVGSYLYTYGRTATTFTDISQTRWYKIKFINSLTGVESVFSDPVYGTELLKAKPFSGMSSISGAQNFSSASDLYAYSSLTSTDVSTDDTNIALKSARAYIDLIMESQDKSRYANVFDTRTTVRKYNAQLEVFKTCELDLALSTIYKNLATKMIKLSLNVPVLQDFTKTNTLPAIADINYGAIQDAYVGIGGSKSVSIGSAAVSQTDNGPFDQGSAADIAKFNVTKNIELDKHNYTKRITEQQFIDDRDIKAAQLKTEQYTNIANQYSAYSESYMAKGMASLFSISSPGINLYYGATAPSTSIKFMDFSVSTLPEEAVIAPGSDILFYNSFSATTTIQDTYSAGEGTYNNSY